MQAPTLSAPCGVAGLSCSSERHMCNSFSLEICFLWCMPASWCSRATSTHVNFVVRGVPPYLENKAGSGPARRERFKFRVWYSAVRSLRRPVRSYSWCVTLFSIVFSVCVAFYNLADGLPPRVYTRADRLGDSADQFPTLGMCGTPPKRALVKLNRAAGGTLS